MKALTIISGLIFFLTINTNAQLKYEGTIDSKYETIQLDDGIFKYLKYNQDEKKVLLYNLDNSLWRTINLPLPSNHFLDEIMNISIHTFNHDDNVELIYSSVVYYISDNLENPDEDFVQEEFTLNIINEMGKSILKVPGSNEMEIIDSEGKKTLLIYKNGDKSYNEKNETIIYSL